MGNELITRDQLQSDLENLYNNKISPYLNGATHTGFTPVGTIISYFGETAPTHYLICDGTAYNKSDYPELWTHLSSLTDTTPYVVDGDNTKFKVPDLRGEFLRGTGTNGHTDQGSGGNVGEHQDATKHIGSAVDFDQWIMAGASSTSGRVEDFDYMAGPGYRTWTPRHSASSSGDFDCGEYTSRPTNTSVLFCIAYKDIYIDYALDGFPVAISNPQDGQGLTFDATTQKWVNGAGGLHEYSTTEKVVGKWIDGRPVYEKTIKLSTPYSNRTIITDLDCDLIIKYEAKIKRNSSGSISYFTDFFISTNDRVMIYVLSFDGGKLGLQLYADDWNMSVVTDCWVTVQYTKTTDTPTVQS